MTTPRLALPTFVAGPADELKAIDVYDVDGTTPINDITSVLDKLSISSLDSFLPKFDAGTLQSLTSGITQLATLKNQFDQKSKNLSPEKLMQQGRMLAPGAMGTLDGSGINLKNDVLNSIKQFEISPAVTQNLTQVFGSSSMDQLLKQNAVTNLVSNIVSPNNNLGLNLGNQRFTSLLLGGIIHQGNNLGMNGFVSDILGAVTDPQTADLIGGLVVASVARSGWLNDLLGLSEKTSYGYIRSVYPTTIPNFVRSYRATIDKNGNRNLATELSTVEQTFGRLDPNWHQERLNNGTYVQSFKSLIGASKDFLDVARYASYTYPAHPIRKNMYHILNMQSLSAETVLKKEFPTLVFKK